MTKKYDLLDTLYGRLRVPDWPDDLIVRSLRQLGEWCSVETELAAELLQPNDVFWDAGAFLGTFSLGIAQQIMPSRILAIDVNPAVSQALQHNLALLSCPSQCVSAGLAARVGWVTPIYSDPDNQGATAYEFSEKDMGLGTAIQCQSLQSLRKTHGNYDFLKIDLEGMEREALAGDTAYLKDHQPVIWAECNENIDSLQLLGFLKWLNYEVLFVAFPAFRKENFHGATDLIYPMAYEASLIAGPAERLKDFAANASKRAPDEDIICRSVTTGYDLRRALFDTPRWAHKDWADLSRAELMARLGRVVQETDLVNFLNTPASKG